MKTIAYSRVSKEKQDINNQRHEIDEYCKRNRIIIDEYVNEISSRSRKDKKIWPVIDRLGKGDFLVITEISRIAGSVMQSFEFMRKCLDRGITAYFIKQNLKLEEENIITEAVMFGFGLAAKIERELISQRTKEALKRKKHEAELRGEKFNIGWKKGRCRVKELEGKEKEIKNKLKMRVMRKRIAEDYGVGLVTLNNFIKSRKIAV